MAIRTEIQKLLELYTANKSVNFTTQYTCTHHALAIKSFSFKMKIKLDKITLLICSYFVCWLFNFIDNR